MTAIYIRFHGWQGFSLVNLEPDLFHHVFKLGFCTFYVSKVCLLNAYRKLRQAMVERVIRDEEIMRQQDEWREK